jgi:hypothetical protein
MYYRYTLTPKMATASLAEMLDISRIQGDSTLKAEVTQSE